MFEKFESGKEGLAQLGTPPSQIIFREAPPLPGGKGGFPSWGKGGLP